jgi:hypothetical protein
MGLADRREHTEAVTGPGVPSRRAYLRTRARRAGRAKVFCPTMGAEREESATSAWRRQPRDDVPAGWQPGSPGTRAANRPRWTDA